MNDQVWWYATRAAGLMTWTTAVASVIVGLLLSTRAVKSRTGPWMLDLHRFLGGISVLFLAVHLVTLWLDSFVEFGPRELFIPGESTWNTEAAAWGIIAAYALVLVELTSLLRKWISVTVWRTFHMLSIVTVAAGTYHAMLGGSDVDNPLTWVIAGAGSAIVIALVALRLKRSDGETSPRVARANDREALLQEMRDRLEGLPIPEQTAQPELTSSGGTLPRRAPVTGRADAETNGTLEHADAPVGGAVGVLQEPIAEPSMAGLDLAPPIPPPAADPFDLAAAPPAAPPADPFATPPPPPGGPDPFGLAPPSPADPFAAPPAEAFADPHAPADPFAAPTPADPFPPSSPAPDSFAPTPPAPDPFTPAADPFAPTADAFPPAPDPFAPTADAFPPAADPGIADLPTSAPPAEPPPAAETPIAPSPAPFFESERPAPAPPGDTPFPAAPEPTPPEPYELDPTSPFGTQPPAPAPAPMPIEPPLDPLRTPIAADDPSAHAPAPPTETALPAAVPQPAGPEPALPEPAVAAVAPAASPSSEPAPAPLPHRPAPPPLPVDAVDPATGEPDEAAYSAWLVEWLAYAEKYGEETPGDPTRVL